MSGKAVAPPNPAWEGMAERVGQVYADAETTIIRMLADRLSRDMGAPDWATKRLAELESARLSVLATMGVAEDDVHRVVIRMLTAAYEEGQGRALADIERAGMPVPLEQSAAAAVTILAADTMTYMTGMRAMVLREADDAYRRIIGETAPSAALGAQARVQATQDALTRFARAGITGMVDRGGRRWRIDSYAEMATRTASINALTTGHYATLRQAGHRFGYINGHGYSCPQCGPWQGCVVSLDGTPSGDVIVPSAVDPDAYVTVHVDGTVEEARASGLWHPNCRHTIGLYLPGTAKPAAYHERDPEGGYDATQRQRSIERHIREWKRAEAAAVTPEAATAARGKVREWQAARRALTAEYPALTPQSRREQIKTAH